MLGSGSQHNDGSLPAIDRTTKLFIGGRQRRPDGNYSRPIFDSPGIEPGQVGEANRKHIRAAVEAAHTAKAWADRTPHNRSQILYYIAENLSIREQEFVSRLITLTKGPKERAQREVTATIDRLFTYAALADKYGGQIQETTLKGIVAAVNEYLGVIGIACPDETPLLSFISLVAPAIARGNTVVVIPSEQWPLLATDFYQILETSDLPAGVINIVTGSRDHLSRVLAEHEDVDAMWYFGSAEGSYFVESLSVSNLKRTWVNYGVSRNWFDREQGQGEEFLLAATQIKNIWIPTGV
jgi:aldehyde dehydrogenase (NAD+)